MNMQDPKVKTAVKAALVEISASMTRIEGERDLIKEAVKKLADEHGLSKKALNKAARVYHKQTFTKEQEEQDEFNTLYETVVGTEE